MRAARIEPTFPRLCRLLGLRPSLFLDCLAGRGVLPHIRSFGMDQQPRSSLTASESRRYRESVANLRRALDERQAPLLSNASRGSWVPFIEGCFTQFNALLTAAICYVAAIAWLQVTYGEVGLLNRKPSSGNFTIASESRPLVGTDLMSFLFALVFVTGSCFYGVYKLQKIKYRAVAAELERMSTLMRKNGVLTGSRSDESETASDILQAEIPAFSALSEPMGKDSISDSVDVEHAMMYRELIVRKFRAEGVEKGTNMITDAWTFANMKMMTIFMRSCFISAKEDNPGDKELELVSSAGRFACTLSIGLMIALPAHRSGYTLCVCIWPASSWFLQHGSIRRASLRLATKGSAQIAVQGLSSWQKIGLVDVRGCSQCSVSTRLSFRWRIWCWAEVTGTHGATRP